MKEQQRRCVMNFLRRVFWFLNRFFMTPAFRMGLGPLICNPVSGYIMVIKNIGRKSGKIYFTPANYAISDGFIYCMAGFGRKSDWYLNLAAHPQTELLLPGRAVTARMEVVSDSAEALKVCKQIFKNAGVAGFFEGYNPWRAPDEKFLKTLKRAPILRFKPISIANGPTDAGGWHWIVLLVAAAWFLNEVL
jgi:deazaflavin-dependent oxidoreductase (nitroreductase family)